MIDRILGLAGGAGSQMQASQLHAFRIILLMAVCAEALMDATAGWTRTPQLAVQFLIGALILGGCLAAVWVRRWERVATLLALGVLVWVYGIRFPYTANHHFLALACMAVLSFFDPRKAQDTALALQGLRWITVIMFFYTGFQKRLYGLYFQGEYFAYFIANKSRFAEFFGYVLPRAELARLEALGPAAPGSGPYRIEWPPAVLASNAVVIAEMLLPLLLLIRKLRPAALAASLVLILAIELGAREFIFGAMFANLLLLFTDKDLNRRLLPVFAALHVLLVVLRVAAPGWAFA